MKTNDIIMKPMKTDNDIMKLIKDERGARAVQYGLLFVGVLLVVAGGMMEMGKR